MPGSKKTLKRLRVGVVLMPEPIKPMLDDLELWLVQRIETEEAQSWVGHAVPGLAGDFTERLNRHHAGDAARCDGRRRR